MAPSSSSDRSFSPKSPSSSDEGRASQHPRKLPQPRQYSSPRQNTDDSIDRLATAQLTTELRAGEGRAGREPLRSRHGLPEKWFQDAGKLGAQRQNWNSLFKTAKLAVADNSSSPPETLRRIVGLIGELRMTYEGISRTERSPRESQNLLNGIDAETSSIFSKVWHLGVDQRTIPQKQAEAQRLLQSFEAHVLQDMLRAIISCFKAFYVPTRLLVEGRDPLVFVLKRLLSICNYIYNLSTEEYVRGRFWSGRMLSPLKRIISTVEAGDLEGDLSPL